MRWDTTANAALAHTLRWDSRTATGSVPTGRQRPLSPATAGTWAPPRTGTAASG